MKKFFKVITGIAAFFGTVLGALAILDRITNKNRIKGDYLNCNDDDII